MSTASFSYRAGARSLPRGQALARRLARYPELLGLLALSAALNLVNLSVNGWANTYYSAAVRSMSTSWHDFLFASLDKTGLMSVDKPPLSLWVQALSARVFGFHQLSLLIPQALMGTAAVALLFDLVHRRFGRVAGFVAGLALATTPVAVAVARHNNPDELLALCSVAALWCAMRALDTRRTRWLVLCGVAVGLGFETKMGVALMVVPGIAAAWMWTAEPRRRARLRALRQLLAGGGAMVAVGGAWPLLVTLTPAADRPWISGTSDNSIWSLILGYNGLGRLAGQTGGPAGGGGTVGAGGPPGAGAGGPGGSLFGGTTGPFRLLQSGLGDQAGWLLGAAVVALLAVLFITRLSRRDPRTGWLIAVGGAFLTTAVAFSFAGGIFHPYYVSLLAPFTAALLGAGIALALDHGRSGRVIAPALLAGGLITELVVLGGLGGRLAWTGPLATVLALGSAIALAMVASRRARFALLTVGTAALLAAPAVWAAQTLGHAESSTFPAGGPSNASAGPGFGGGGPAGRFGGPGLGGGGPAALFGGSRSFGPSGPPPGSFGGGGSPGAGGPAGPLGGGALGAGPGGGAFGGYSSQLATVIRYTRTHGAGAIGVASQSTAAAAILATKSDVAGLGGFSGRESSVSAQWLAQVVAAGRLRWLVVESSSGARLPGDTRTGSQSAFDIAARACRRVSVAGSSSKLYDCAGRASAILAAARS